MAAKPRHLVILTACLPLPLSTAVG
jgi:hypothetical protein